jgi:type III secretion protein J
MKQSLLPLLLMIVLAACTHKIEVGLSEREAQEIVVTLRESGIDAYAEPDSLGKKDNALWQVKIRGGGEQTVTAWKILREHGLPHEKVEGLDDVFKNSGMIPTATEEKARMVVGLAGELTRTLRSLPGVVDARVHVVLPDNSTLIDEKNKAFTTASVLVRYRGDHPPLSDAEIRGLVAKGVEGLAAENVDVVQKRTNETPLPPQMIGPLASREWTTIGALALCGITSAGALTTLLVSKRRGYRIRVLERQLAQLSQNSGRLEGNIQS